MERNSFLWSQARLVIAAVALFLGGVPPVFYLVSGGLVVGLLRIAWLISGIASFYLAYRWFMGGEKVFGGKDRNDTIAFLVSVVSGLNLGWTAISGTNIGMTISSNHVVFFLVAVVYLVSAYYLQMRYNARGNKLF